MTNSTSAETQVGYYIHHSGRGHLQRALTVTRDLAAEQQIVATGLSSLSRPQDWPGPWVQLARDDEDPIASQVTAGGRLHWAPVHDQGLLARHGAVSAWIARVRPRAMVVDVSAEVTVLARLHGIPVLTVALPGRRDDPAHELAFDVADEVVGFWPESHSHLMLAASAQTMSRLRAIGSVSRFPTPETLLTTRCESDSPTSTPRVVALSGAGAPAWTHDQLRIAETQTRGWSWGHLPDPGGRWIEDPRALLESADVVITHAGQNAIAEVASLRRPAIVVPAHRPHHEQTHTAAALTGDEWPAIVLNTWPTTGWADLLQRAKELPGESWSAWCDGRAAVRMAALVAEVAYRW